MLIVDGASVKPLMELIALTGIPLLVGILVGYCAPTSLTRRFTSPLGVTRGTNSR
jgi:hypothetical protein